MQELREVLRKTEFKKFCVSLVIIMPIAIIIGGCLAKPISWFLIGVGIFWVVLAWFEVVYILLVWRIRAKALGWKPKGEIK
jgi:hypothetical protein